ncbi:MAG: SpoIIE family protein phosphatase [Acidimicrobiales bacterium]
MGLVEVDPTGVIVNLNPAALRLIVAAGCCDASAVAVGRQHRVEELFPREQVLLEALRTAPEGPGVLLEGCALGRGGTATFAVASVIRISADRLMVLVSDAHDAATGSPVSAGANTDEPTRMAVVARNRQILANVSFDLSRVASVAEVAEVVAHGCVNALGAHLGGLFLVNAARTQLIMADSQGADELVDPWRLVPLEPELTPMCRVVRERLPHLLGTAADIAREWPHLEQERVRQGAEAWATLPLDDGREVVGVLALGFAAPQRFDDVQRELMMQLCDRVTEALKRAQLYEAERRERRRWEAAETRTRRAYQMATALAAVTGTVSAQRAVLTELAKATESTSAFFFELDRATRQLRLVRPHGSPQRAQDGWTTFDAGSGLPLVEAVETASLVILRNAEELRARVGDRWRGEDGRIQAWACLPLEGDSGPLGVVALGFDRPLHTEEDVFLSLLARQAALAVERAQLHETEHRIAMRLQRALLPELRVDHPRLAVHACYQPGQETLEVGGDWYDAFALPDGSVALSVGDVVGSGLDAAAKMGRLRHGMAALAPHASTTAELLTHLGHFAATGDGIDFATVAYAVVNTETATLRYSLAGHPPGLIVDRTGAVRWLDKATGHPLFGEELGVRVEANMPFPVGSLLVLYSDGLIERRGESITVGLARLEEAVRELRALPLEQLCDELLRRLRSDDQGDDTVVLCARFLDRSARQWRHSFSAHPAQLGPMRSSLRSWLEQQDLPDELVADVVLCVHEACSNSIEHAYRGGSGPVDAAGILAEGWLSVEVSDSGTWLRVVPSVERGRGTAIMQQLSQRFGRRAGTEGTTVSLHFVVPSPEGL